MINGKRRVRVLGKRRRGIAMTDSPNYLTPLEMVERYRGQVTIRTLANWRSNKEGPKFTKIGGRVLYALRDVQSWELSRQPRGM